MFSLLLLVLMNFAFTDFRHLFLHLVIPHKEKKKRRNDILVEAATNTTNKHEGKKQKKPQKQFNISSMTSHLIFGNDLRGTHHLIILYREH